MRNIVFYCEHGFRFSELSTSLDIFGKANEINNSYRMIIVAELCGPVRSDIGISVYAKAISDMTISANDTLSLVGLLHSKKTTEPGLSACIKQVVKKGATLMMTDIGISHVARTLPTLKFRAAVNASNLKKFNSINRNVSARTNGCVCIDDQFWSASGPLATFAMSLQLVQQHEGSETAENILRLLPSPGCYNIKKNQTMSNYSKITSREKKWSELESWIKQNITERLSVDQLADHMAMSSRTFTRHCNERFKMSPKKLVEKARLELALDMIINTQLTLGSIALSSGYARAENMQRSFLRELGFAPSTLRDKKVA